eukprot:201754_1
MLFITFLITFLINTYIVLSRQYSIGLDTAVQGGSTDTFYARIKGSSGQFTDIFQFHDLSNSGSCPCYDTYSLIDVGDAKYLYLMSNGNDALIVDEVWLDGKEIDEWLQVTTLEYSGSASKGCAVLIAALDADSISEEDYSICPFGFDALFTTKSPTKVPSTSPTTQAPTTKTPTTTTPTTATPTTQSPTLPTHAYTVRIVINSSVSSNDNIYGRIEGETGDFTEIFGIATPNKTDTLQLLDVGASKILYLMSYSNDTILVDEIWLDDNKIGVSSKILSYRGILSTGCGLLISNFYDNITVKSDYDRCPYGFDVILPTNAPTPFPTIVPTIHTDNPTSNPTIKTLTYSIGIDFLAQGGSTSKMYGRIQGNTGEFTEVFYLGSIETASNCPCYFNFELKDVGTPKKLYLMTRGSDRYLVDEIWLNGNEIDELFQYTSFGYQGNSPTGCAILIGDLDNNNIPETDYDNCPYGFGEIVSPLLNYTIGIDLAPLGGSTAKIYGRIEGHTGNLTEMFIIDSIPTSSNCPCYWTFQLKNVGDAQKIYLMSRQQDRYLMDEIWLNGEEIDELGQITSFGYQGSSLFGCAILIGDVLNNNIAENDYEICPNPFNDVISISDRYNYSIGIDLVPQGGSTEKIYGKIEGDSGNLTEVFIINNIPSANDCPCYWTFELKYVSRPVKVYLMTTGSNRYLMDEIWLNGKEIDELLQFTSFGYQGSSPWGCAILIGDLDKNDIHESDYNVCPYPFDDVGLYPTNHNYFIGIDLVPQGGSTEKIYGKIEGDSGNLTEVFIINNIPSANDCPCWWSYELKDVGEPKKIYLMTTGSNRYLMDEIWLNGKEIDELLQYTSFAYQGSSPWGCAILIGDLYKNDIPENDHIVCPYPFDDIIHYPERYNHTIGIDLTWKNGFVNQIYGRIEGHTGNLTEIFMINNTNNITNCPCYWTFDLKNVGVATKIYLMTGRDEYLIDEIWVNSLEIDDIGTHSFGFSQSTGAAPCTILIGDVYDNDITVRNYDSCTYPFDNVIPTTPAPFYILNVSEFHDGSEFGWIQYSNQYPLFLYESIEHWSVMFSNDCEFVGNYYTLTYSHLFTEDMNMTNIFCDYLDT